MKEKQDVLFYRFTCHNESVLTITHIDPEDIDYYGGKSPYLLPINHMDILTK